MLFSSMSFLVLFLPVTLAGYFLLPKVLKNLWLLAVSMIFYAWGEPEFVVIMAACIAMNYGFGLAADKFRDNKYGGRIVLILMTFCNLGILGYYKYMNFFVENVNRLAGKEVLAPTAIALPIGISFFTFQAMSYVIDVYRKNGNVQKNILNVGLYIAFFPQLIAGPIVRYETFSAQIKDHPVRASGFQAGVHRFLYGFIKKVLIANTMAVIADYIFTLPAAGELTVGAAWLGAVSYTFQIYFDFQGYMNMAIGLGRMFGIRLQENFDHPYTSTSITDFWRRWHRTLGSWFRDYVYIPLGGNRKGLWRTLRNLMLVWGLTGFWHGASWTFLLWGLYYGILLILEKFVLHPYLKRLPSAARMMLTFAMVMLGWVLFASDGLSQAVVYYRQLFTTTHGVVDRQTLSLLVNYGFWLCAAAVFSTRAPLVVSSNLMYALREQQWFLKPVLTIVVLVILLSCLMSAGYQSFLYVQF